MATSPHFSDAELRCRHCRVNKVRADFLGQLEQLRARVGAPIVLRSGYRCPVHNQAVGGARKSQHLYGLAVDLRDGLSFDLVRGLRLFSGLGTSGGRVVHVDSRHLNPATNPTGGRPDAPTRWKYD